MRRHLLPLLLLALPLPMAQAVEEPSAEEMLSALNVTVAYVEYCGIELPDDVALNVAAAGRMLELDLGLERDEADSRYIRLKETVVLDPPDCAVDGPDIAPILDALGVAR